MDDELRTARDRQLAAEDDLASLLQLARRPPRLPEDEVEPIRAAARELFRRQARRAARRRRLGWAAAASLAATLLLIAALALRGPTGPGPHPPVASFEMRTGSVSVTVGDGQPSASQNLSAGAVIATGHPGRAAVRLAAGASMRIDADSAVRLDSSRVVTLERGAVYVDTGAAAATSGRVEIATAFGTIRDIGTQFEARLVPGGLRVRVREGRVVVAGAGEARAGGQLIVRADGSVQRSEVPVYGPGWDWVQRAAPPLAIEGASLADFLAWASRETGLRWRLAEPDAGRPPGEIILHGSIAGLTADEALAVVLPGCGYKHRRVGDVLWLERTENRSDSTPQP